MLRGARSASASRRAHALTGSRLLAPLSPCTALARRYAGSMPTKLPSRIIPHSALGVGAAFKAGAVRCWRCRCTRVHAACCTPPSSLSTAQGGAEDTPRTTTRHSSVLGAAGCVPAAQCTGLCVMYSAVLCSPATQHQGNATDTASLSSQSTLSAKFMHNELSVAACEQMSFTSLHFLRFLSSSSTPCERITACCREPARAALCSDEA